MKILRSRRSLAVVAGMKKQMTTQNRQKSNAKKNNTVVTCVNTNYDTNRAVKCLMLVAEKKGFNISDNRYRKYDEKGLLRSYMGSLNLLWL